MIKVFLENCAIKRKRMNLVSLFTEGLNLRAKLKSKIA